MVDRVYTLEEKLSLQLSLKDTIPKRIFFKKKLSLHMQKTVALTPCQRSFSL